MNPWCRIILIGMKSSGKTAVGKALARRLCMRFVDMDAEIEQRHATEKGEVLPFRDIFKQYGKDYFRTLETAALRAMAAQKDTCYILATGGGLPLTEENRVLLKPLGTIVFLDADQEVLLARIVARGIPAFFPYPDDPARSLAELLAARRPVYAGLANVTVPCHGESIAEVVEKVVQALEKYPHED